MRQKSRVLRPSHPSRLLGVIGFRFTGFLGLGASLRFWVSDFGLTVVGGV